MHHYSSYWFPSKCQDFAALKSMGDLPLTSSKLKLGANVRKGDAVFRSCWKTDKFCETLFLELCADCLFWRSPLPCGQALPISWASRGRVLVWQGLWTVVEVTVLIGEWLRELPLPQVAACTSSAHPITILILKDELHAIMGVRRLCRN